jgi:hypothetical protein
MQDLRILGVDLGKNSCIVVGLDAAGRRPAASADAAGGRRRTRGQACQSSFERCALKRTAATGRITRA